VVIQARDICAKEGLKIGTGSGGTRWGSKGLKSRGELGEAGAFFFFFLQELHGLLLQAWK